MKLKYTDSLSPGRRRGACGLKAAGMVSGSILSPLMNLHMHKALLSRLFTHVRFSLLPEQNNGVTVKKHNSTQLNTTQQRGLKVLMISDDFIFLGKQLFDSLETPQTDGKSKEMMKI